MGRIIDSRHVAMGGNNKRIIGRITHIGLHHSGTATGSREAFERHWRSLGWGTGGYSWIIHRNGDIEWCYDDNVITNGIAGHNATTLHVCVVGNGSFTPEQEASLDRVLKEAMLRLRLGVDAVRGHNEFSGTNTSCPGRDMNALRARLRAQLQPPVQSPAPQPQAATQASTASAQTRPVLRRGSQGEAVRELQTLLNQHGANPRLVVDGKFGPITENAVRIFQKTQNIAADSVVGPITWGRLLNASVATGDPNITRYFAQSKHLGIVAGLNAIRVDSSFANRARIARVNGISNYTGTIAQNLKLNNLLRTGKLRRP